jgi:hypothetical protein
LDKTEQGEKFIPSAVEGSPGRSTGKGTPRKRGSSFWTRPNRARSSSRARSREALVGQQEREPRESGVLHFGQDRTGREVHPERGRGKPWSVNRKGNPAKAGLCCFCPDQEGEELVPRPRGGS